MWRSLTPIGSRMTPDLTAGQPDPTKAEPELDDEGEQVLNPVGDPIWRSTAQSFEDAFNQIGNGECTFSHLGDGPEETRQCKDATGTISPPPAGKFFYPSAVAVNGDTIYVADLVNHRVQVMDYFGNPIAISFPIGNGEPGIDQYPPYAGGIASGQSGWRLNAPTALAVDGDGKLLVADSGDDGRGRIAMFMPNGSLASQFIVEPDPRLEADEVAPTSVAISKGAVAAPGGVPANADHRIAVVDRFTCSVFIYDTAFNPVAILPESLPEQAAEGACSEAELPHPAGEFSVITGVAIDDSNRIYLADAFSNRIAVYDKDGDFLGSFGEPPAGAAETPVEALETPSALIIDHKNRVVVNDSDNLRIVFYEVTFPPSGGVTAAFQFEVPAPGDDLEAYHPTGLAEQAPNLPSLEPWRYLKIDTANHRVQRLELADLAIVRSIVQYDTETTGTGRFAVAVPKEKGAAVTAVVVQVLGPSGVMIGTPTAQHPITPAASHDIAPGTWVEYAFTFTAPQPRMAIDFTIKASGNKASGQATQADDVGLKVRGACDSCAAKGTVYADQDGDPEPAETDSSGAYLDAVFARLEAADGSEPIKYVEWRVTGTEMPRYGSGVHRSELTGDEPFVDVPFDSPDSTITFWPVTDGPAGERIGAAQVLRIRIRGQEPGVIVVRALPMSKTYGSDDPVFEYSVEGELDEGDEFSGELAREPGEAMGNYKIVQGSLSLPDHYILHYHSENFAIALRAVTVTADSHSIILGSAIPALSYRVTNGAVMDGDEFSGALKLAVSGPLGVGEYDIVQDDLTLGRNYTLNVIPGKLTISANRAPIAHDDAATAVGAAAVTINVLANDSDLDGHALTITTFTQPVPGGSVTRSDNSLEFRPTPGFVGPASFDYTIVDPFGGTDTATVTVTVSAPPSCAAGVFTTTGNSGTSGSTGNIRTFTASGVSVRASAFSRSKSGSSWAKAFLGAFSGGLGVTDSSESGGGDTHKTDNIGSRWNFVLFEFSSPVVITRAFLDSIGDDADVMVWIGTRTNPYTNHLTLSDALFAQLGMPQTVALSGSTSRWVNFNGGHVSGNVLVIAADVSDTTPDDAFKIRKLDMTCGAANQPPSVTASNQSHAEGQPVSVAIAATDAEDDDLTYRATGLPSGLSINAVTGVISGTLSYSSAGSHNVRITVTDEDDAAASAWFVWTVANKNRAPDAVNDSTTTAKNSSKTITVLANDRDPDGDALTVTTVTQPTKGKVVKNANGTIKFTPAPNWIGTASFTYTVSDGKNGTDTATVSVTVSKHRDSDDCDRDHDHDGDRDRDDDRERDCDRDHRHNRDCDRHSNKR